MDRKDLEEELHNATGMDIKLKADIKMKSGDGIFSFPITQLVDQFSKRLPNRIIIMSIYDNELPQIEIVHRDHFRDYLEDFDIENIGGTYSIKNDYICVETGDSDTKLYIYGTDENSKDILSDLGLKEKKKKSSRGSR